MTRAKAESESAAGATNEPGAGLALAEERIGTRIAAKEGLGFDPAMIIMIISAIIPLIQGCFQPKASALRQRLFNRSRLATAIRRETRCTYQQALTRADDVLDAANDATDEELNLLIRDCCT